MQQPDPNFPALPFVPDEEYRRWTKEQRWKRHLLEVAEAARIFGALQAAGVNIFDAAERVPTPRANRAGARQSDLRRLYQEEPRGRGAKGVAERSEVLPPAAE
jgi:hypothetical protein